MLVDIWTYSVKLIEESILLQRVTKRKQHPELSKGTISVL